MDVLSDVLSAVKLLGSLYFTTEFRPPWGVRVPRYRRVSRFHVVLRGSCWVATADHLEPVALEAGDLVLIPHGAEHTLADAPKRRYVGVDRLVERTGFRGEGPLIIDGDSAGNPTRLLCGHFEFDESIEHPLLTRLPSMIVARHDRANTAELDDLIRFIAREVGREQPGSEAMLRRLSEVLFIQAVRNWAASEGPEQGLLAALADAHLSRSLLAIHANVATSWTLQKLARHAGLSRTAFAERFRKLVAMAPMQYVTLWRMQRARELLKRQHLTVEAAAREVGYESLPAFSRAFKRWVGTSPGAYRRLDSREINARAG